MTSLPKWDEIPNLDLYLDQVLLYVNQQIETVRPHQDKALTAAMINNYVKHGHLPKPTKKKYNRQHVARLMVLSLCKPVFAIPEIAHVIDKMYDTAEPAVLYNQFVDCFVGQTPEGTPLLVQKVCQTIQSYDETLQLARGLDKEEKE